MVYFDKDYVKFFAELAKNNNKEWFDENRKRYEQVVREPFKKFTEDLIIAYNELYPGTTMTAKDAVSRINRDIRFSKDKTPYKDHMGCTVSKYGKKEWAKPGIYLQANNNDIRIYSGAYQLDKHQLQNLRQYMVDNLKELNSILNAKDFKSTYGEVRGEKNKRIPKEFEDAGQQQPLIYNKSIYYFFKQDPSVLTKEGLIEGLMKDFKKSMPLNNFLEEALS